MIKISKNTLHLASVPIKQTDNFYNDWRKKIVSIIKGYIGTNKISFLSYYAPNESIASQFCNGHYKIKTYDNTHYYYSSANLSEGDIALLIDDEEFALGNIILIVGEYDEKEANLIALYRERELTASGKEIFRMGEDGTCFYCFNMQKDFDNKFQSLLQNLR